MSSGAVLTRSDRSVAEKPYLIQAIERIRPSTASIEGLAVFYSTINS
jgi:hypothetical protein